MNVRVYVHELAAACAMSFCGSACSPWPWLAFVMGSALGFGLIQRGRWHP